MARPRPSPNPTPSRPLPAAGPPPTCANTQQPSAQTLVWGWESVWFGKRPLIPVRPARSQRCGRRAPWVSFQRSPLLPLRWHFCGPFSTHPSTTQKNPFQTDVDKRGERSAQPQSPVQRGLLLQVRDLPPSAFPTATDQVLRFEELKNSLRSDTQHPDKSKTRFLL